MKMLKLIVRESSGNYIPPKLALGSVDEGSIRDQIMAAGFELSEEVVVIPMADLMALQAVGTGACGPGCQNGGKCWDK